MMKSERIGALVEGFFYCDSCATKLFLKKYQMDIWKENVHPYLQYCSECRKLIVKPEIEFGGKMCSLFPVKKKTAFTIEDILIYAEDMKKHLLLDDAEAMASTIRALLIEFVVSFDLGIITDSNEAAEEIVKILKRFDYIEK